MNDLSVKTRRLSLRVAVAMTVITLGACGGSGGSATPTSEAPPVPVPTATPTATPTPTPTPTVTPTPTATPTPAPTATPSGGRLTVVAEGDSISYFWAGNHTGMYAASHPNVIVLGKAVGGSSVVSMTARIDAVLAAKPNVTTFLIGANDLGGAQWISRVYAYADRLRSAGIRVAIGTVLPLCDASNPAHTATFSANRIVANTLIRSGLGTKFDAVIDYAADPTIGPDAAACDKTLYGDGVHPTDVTQARMATLYGTAVDALLSRL